MSFEMPTANEMKEEVLSLMKDVVYARREKMTSDELALYSLELNELRKEFAEGIRAANAEWDKEFVQFYYTPNHSKERDLLHLLENIEVELLALGYDVSIKHNGVNLKIRITW